jgi:tripartite-type tricarboxylate transporter receptor subunit TctC
MWKKYVLVTAFSAGTALLSATAPGQGYPDKPIRLVGSLPGGGSDLVMRLIAPGLKDALGQPVIVDNRASLLLGEIGAAAPPDGYTLIVVGSSFMIGHLLRKTTWDPIKDFLPVTLADAGPSVLLVHPSVPVKSVKELIALARAKPGTLNYGTGSPGSSAHLAGELFKSMVGVNLVWIPYKDQGLGMNALIGGETQVMFKDAGGVPAHIEAGRVRALAVTSGEPSPLFPGLPTVAASGVPGYEALAVDAVVVPARTPVAIIRRLNSEIVRSLQQPSVKQTLFNTGVIVVGNSPEELGKFMASEIEKWGKVIKEAGIRAE